MARDNLENWHIRKCATACSSCGKPFQDQHELFSQLLFNGEEYVRHDFCQTCRPASEHVLSAWKTVFLTPPQPQDDVVKKENVESLLRRLLMLENEADLEVIFILVVMLERKKILVERDARQTEAGHKLRIYEHRKTGESFMIIDPQLKLDELEKVQGQVAILLGAPPRRVASEDGVL